MAPVISQKENTVSLWNDSRFTREAERGTGFTPADVPDDLYEARIIEVGEPQDVQDIFAKEPGKMKTQFYIQWEIKSDDLEEGTSLRQYMTLPDAYLNSGYLNEKSNLFHLMDALGFDMAARFKVDPPSWVGKRARVMVENKPNKEGEFRPRITDVKPLRKKAGAVPAARTRTDEDDD